MPRNLKRYQNTGQLHFITFSCYRRMPLLRTPGKRSLFLRVLESTRKRCGWVVVGYVVAEWKLDAIAKTGCTVVASDNPGCLIHIATAARRRRMDLRVAHVLELVAEHREKTRPLGYCLVKVTLVATAPADITIDSPCHPSCYRQRLSGGAVDLDRALGGLLSDLLEGRVQGAPHEILPVPSNGRVCCAPRDPLRSRRRTRSRRPAHAVRPSRADPRRAHIWLHAACAHARRAPRSRELAGGRRGLRDGHLRAPLATDWRAARAKRCRRAG